MFLKSGLAASAAALLFLVPSVATAAPFSDALIVRDGTGAIVAEGVSSEAGPEPNFVYVNVAGNAALFGAYTTFLEPNGSVSDAFGVAVGGPQAYTLGFYSDTDTSSVLIGPGAVNIAEPNGPYNITRYLDPGLQDQGWTATFESDARVPEPATLGIIGAGLAGIALRRRKSKA